MLKEGKSHAQGFIVKHSIFLVQGLGNVNREIQRTIKISLYSTFHKHIFVVKCIMLTELSTKPHSGCFKAASSKT